jgi:hypothetical protein
LKDEVADCLEEPGALEVNVLNQAAGSWHPVTIAGSILAAKVQESSVALFTIVTRWPAKVAMLRDCKLKIGCRAD